jgi:hypothetical protein
VALPVFLNHFDPDTGILIISSPVAMKRVANVRQRPKVAILFSPDSFVIFTGSLIALPTHEQ